MQGRANTRDSDGESICSPDQRDVDSDHDEWPSISDSDSSSEGDHEDQWPDSKLKFNGEITHQCFAHTNLNRSFLEIFLWELNLNYRGVRQVIVCGDDYEHQTERVPKALFEEGCFLHDALHAMPEGARFIEKLPTAVRLDGEVVDPPGSLRYIRDNIKLHNKIRKYYIGTVDIDTGLGSPYHSDVKRNTSDGDPIEKQGVIMKVDPSISLSQQTAVNFSGSLQALHRVMLRQSIMSSKIHDVSSCFLGALTRPEAHYDRLPSKSLQILRDNATCSDFRNHIQGGGVSRIPWEAYEIIPLNPSTYDWIPSSAAITRQRNKGGLRSCTDIHRNVENEFIGAGSDKSSNSEKLEIWKKRMLFLISNYFTYCASFSHYVSDVGLSFEAETVQPIDLHLSFDDGDEGSTRTHSKSTYESVLEKAEWKMGVDITVSKPKIPDQHNAISVTNNNNTTFFFTVRGNDVIVFIRSIEEKQVQQRAQGQEQAIVGDIDKISLVNSMKKFAKLGKCFKSFGGIRTFIMKFQIDLFEISINARKDETFRIVFPIKTEAFIVSRRMDPRKKMQSLFKFVLKFYNAVDVTLKDGWGPWDSTKYGMKWVKVVFSIDRDAKMFFNGDSKLLQGQGSSPQRVFLLPHSFYSTTHWVEFENILVISKMADSEMISRDTANAFQIQDPLGNCLTFTVRNGILLLLRALSPDGGWIANSNKVHELVNLNEELSLYFDTWLTFNGVVRMLQVYGHVLWEPLSEMHASHSSPRPVYPDEIDANGEDLKELEDDLEIEDWGESESDISPDSDNEHREVMLAKVLLWFDVVLGSNKLADISSFLGAIIDPSENIIIEDIGAQCFNDRRRFKIVCENWLDGSLLLAADASDQYYLIGKRNFVSPLDALETAVKAISLIFNEPVENLKHCHFDEFSSKIDWYESVCRQRNNVFTALTTGRNGDSANLILNTGTFKYWNFQAVELSKRIRKRFINYLRSVYIAIVNFKSNYMNPPTIGASKHVKEFTSWYWGNLVTFDVFLWVLILQARDLGFDDIFKRKIQNVASGVDEDIITPYDKSCIASAFNLQIVEFIPEEDLSLSEESNRGLIKVDGVTLTRFTYFWDETSFKHFSTERGEPPINEASRNFTRVKCLCDKRLVYLNERTFDVSLKQSFYATIASRLKPLEYFGTTRGEVVIDSVETLQERVSRVKERFISSMHEVFRRGRVRSGYILNGNEGSIWDDDWEGSVWDESWQSNHYGVEWQKTMPIHWFKFQSAAKSILSVHENDFKSALEMMNQSADGGANELNIDHKIAILHRLYDSDGYSPFPVEMEMFAEACGISLVIFTDSDTVFRHLPHVSVMHTAMDLQSHDKIYRKTFSLEIYGKSGLFDRVMQNQPDNEYVLLMDPPPPANTWVHRGFRNILSERNVTSYKVFAERGYVSGSLFNEITFPGVPGKESHYKCFVKARMKPVSVHVDSGDVLSMELEKADDFEIARVIDRFISKVCTPVSASKEEIARAKMNVGKKDGLATKRDYDIINGLKKFGNFLEWLTVLGEKKDSATFSDIKYRILSEIRPEIPGKEDKVACSQLWNMFTGGETFKSLPAKEKTMLRWFQNDLAGLYARRVGVFFFQQLAKYLQKRILILEWNDGMDGQYGIPDGRSYTKDLFNVTKIHDFCFDETATNARGDKSVEEISNHPPGSDSPAVNFGQDEDQVLKLFLFSMCKDDESSSNPALKVSSHRRRIFTEVLLPRNTELPFHGSYPLVSIGSDQAIEKDDRHTHFINTDLSETWTPSSYLGVGLQQFKLKYQGATGEMIPPIQIHILKIQEHVEGEAEKIQQIIVDRFAKNKFGDVKNIFHEFYPDVVFPHVNDQEMAVETDIINFIVRWVQVHPVQIPMDKAKDFLDFVAYYERRMSELKIPRFWGQVGYTPLLCHGIQESAPLGNIYFSKLYKDFLSIIVQDESNVTENKEERKGGKKRKKKRDVDELLVVKKSPAEINAWKMAIKRIVVETGIDPSTVMQGGFRVDLNHFSDFIIWRKVVNGLTADTKIYKKIKKIFRDFNELTLQQHEWESWGTWRHFQRSVQILLQIMYSDQSFDDYPFPTMNGMLSGLQKKFLKLYRDTTFLRDKSIPLAEEYLYDLKVMSEEENPDVNFEGILHPSNFKLNVAVRIIDFYLRRYRIIKEKKDTENSQKVNLYDDAFEEFLRTTRERWHRHAWVPSGGFYSDEKYDKYYLTLTPKKQYELLTEDSRMMCALYYLKIDFVHPFGNYDANSFLSKDSFYYYILRYKGQNLRVTDLNDLFFVKHGLQWPDTPVRMGEFKKSMNRKFKTYKFLKKVDPLRLHLLLNLHSNSNDGSVEIIPIRPSGLYNPRCVYSEPCTQGRGRVPGLSSEPDAPRGELPPPSSDGPQAARRGPPRGGGPSDGAVDGDCPNRQSGGGHVARGDQRSEAQRERMEREREMWDNGNSSMSSCFEVAGGSKWGHCCTGAEVDLQPLDTVPPSSLFDWQKKGLDILQKTVGDDDGSGITNEDGKEIYMLSARMGSTMATLNHLNEGAFIAVKIHKAIQPQAQAFACLLSSCFSHFTAIPFTDVYTDNIQFVGRGFNKKRFHKYQLMSKLQSCMSLREDDFQSACEALANEYNDSDRRQLEHFKKHLAWCGDKVYADRFKHDILMCQVYLEGTLDGRIKPRLPWISKKSARLLNRKVFYRVPSEVRNRNVQIIRSILESPAGVMLKPLFTPTCDPEIPLPCVTVSDQLQCLVTSSGRLSSQMELGTQELVENEENIGFIISLTESLDRRLRALEDSLG